MVHISKHAYVLNKIYLVVFITTQIIFPPVVFFECFFLICSAFLDSPCITVNLFSDSFWKSRHNQYVFRFENMTLHLCLAEQQTNNIFSSYTLVNYNLKMCIFSVLHFYDKNTSHVVLMFLSFQI